ncbi:hypothetical protein KAW80_01715 [Candidatus Babeliales bacterium]|nr:hypothetical protein [Candidatus Babeliales bacterium]
MYKKKKGAILVFTLLVLAIIAVLSLQLLRGVRVHSYFASTVVAREQAKMLCLGGIRLATAQLTQHLYDKNLEEEKRKDSEFLEKQFLSNVLPFLNKWQFFPLTKKEDGFDGEIKISISCEHGKANFNKIYFDYKNNKFKPVVVKELADFSRMSGLKFDREDLQSNISKFFKDRKIPLNEISELLEIKGFENWKLFYEPPEKIQDKEEAQKRPVALMDMFTLWTDNKVDPWMLSDGTCFSWELRRPEWGDAEKRKVFFERSIKRFKKDLGKNWSENWDVLLPMYGVRPTKMPFRLLSQQFDSRVYTVISCGKVRGIEQKVLVILELLNKKLQNKDSRKENVPAKILKVYWL